MEDFVSCPLVKNHRVLRHRLQNHLLKCRRALKITTGEEWIPREVVTPNRYDPVDDCGENWDNCEPAAKAMEKKKNGWITFNAYDPVDDCGENWDNCEPATETIAKEKKKNGEQQWVPQEITLNGYLPVDDCGENWDNCNSPSYLPTLNHPFQKPPPFLSRKQRKCWKRNNRINYMYH